jgi:glycosyltransferase involved in cell wall biosynthesis
VNEFKLDQFNFSKKLKINFIGTGLFKSGGIRVIFEYANRLSQRGHDVYFYYPVKAYKFSNDNLTLLLKKNYWALKSYLFNEQEQIEQFRRFYSCRFNIIRIPQIRNIFVRNANATIATQWPTTFDLDKLSNNKGKKIYFIQDYETWDSDTEMVDSSFKLNFKRITISNYNKKLFYDKFKIDTEVILNGIDYEIFNCMNKLANKNKIITFIDHPLSNKGVTSAIEVIKKLKKKYNYLQFMGFGHEKYHDIPEFVKFYKNPDDKTVAKEIYGKTDIFIYPSTKEGFALPPAEAMACKCAVVTTKVGAVPEYSVHMESAIHVEPNNIDQLYEGVCYLLDNENEIKRISENAYTHIRKVLNWEDSVKKFEKSLLE